MALHRTRYNSPFTCTLGQMKLRGCFDAEMGVGEDCFQLSRGCGSFRLPLVGQYLGLQMGTKPQVPIQEIPHYVGSLTVVI